MDSTLGVLANNNAILRLILEQVRERENISLVEEMSILILMMVSQVPTRLAKFLAISFSRFLHNACRVDLNQTSFERNRFT